MFKRGLMLVSLMLSVSVIYNAEAKLYKWVDKEGATHYGEVIPPEYADRDTQTLNIKGQLSQRPNKNEPELQRGSQEAANQKKAEAIANAEQKRRDNTLLNTYSNEKEIDLALDRNMQLLESRVSSFTTMVKSAQETVDEHHKEVDMLTKGGRKAPQSLLDDVAASEARLERLKKDLAHSEQEVIAVKTRFEADKARYRELKGYSKK